LPIIKYNRFPGIIIQSGGVLKIPDIGFVLGEEGGGEEEEEERQGEEETGGAGEKETGRLGDDWAIGRLGDWKIGGLKDLRIRRIRTGKNVLKFRKFHGLFILKWLDKSRMFWGDLQGKSVGQSRLSRDLRFAPIVSWTVGQVGITASLRLAVGQKIQQSRSGES